MGEEDEGGGDAVAGEDQSVTAGHFERDMARRVARRVERHDAGYNFRAGFEEGRLVLDERLSWPWMPITMPSISFGIFEARSGADQKPNSVSAIWNEAFGKVSAPSLPTDPRDDRDGHGCR